MQDMVIFADYGIDDAAATVSIFNHSDRFDRITLIPIRSRNRRCASSGDAAEMAIIELL